MRSPRATFVAALTSTLLAAVVPATALAAPADVHVRVEGVTRTIFDGVVRTDGREVRAASDDRPRTCDGTNNGANPEHGPTPTAATVDAMAAIGQDFDGDWYAGFDDYFLTRWGPESEDDSQQFWWGILVNGSFTPVGGCQQRIVAGDRVLWVNHAFGSRPFLSLAGAAKAVAGQPYSATVTSTVQSTGGDDPDADPYAGAEVDAVTAMGQPAPAGTTSGPGTSALDGGATVVFQTLGWQRLKARTTGAVPVAIASDGIDVCVVATVAETCAGTPPSQRPVNVEPEPRTPEPRTPEPRTPEPRAPEPRSPEPRAPDAQPRAPEPQPRTAAPVRITVPSVATRNGDGTVGVTWSVLDRGVGVARWEVASKPLGSARARFTARASGSDATTTSLRLPAGRSYALRFTLRDAAGRTSTHDLGQVLMPLDDRARAVSLRGGWSAGRDAGAWLRTISRGKAGAQLRVTLASGKPAFLLRGAARGTRVELVSPSGRRRRRVATSARRITGVSQRGGAVTLRVLSGEVRLDGVGVAP